MADKSEDVNQRATVPGREFYLPRLEAAAYQACAVVHWTLPIAHRATGWLSDILHARFRELMLHSAAREGLLCPTYCLMPDHMHLLWLGTRKDADQRNGMTFLRTYLEPALGSGVKFQHQAYDHVLSERERRWDAFRETCGYILQNPVRAGFVADEGAWAYSGAIAPGYPKLDPRDARFWSVWTKVQRNAQRHNG